MTDSVESKSGLGASLACLFLIILLAYGMAQLYAGWVGIKHHLGFGWAVASVVAALVFRFSLPMTVGSFFGAMTVWGWHWAGALAFAAPGLAFMALMVPGALSRLIDNIRRRPE